MTSKQPAERGKIRLHQLLAIEKGDRAKSKATIDQAYKLVQRPQLFNGMSRNYQRDNDDGEKFPPERVPVQVTVDDLLEGVQKHISREMCTAYRRDEANQRARADVILDGNVVIANAPATFLLYLEKQLIDMGTFLGKVPVLDTAEKWTEDTSTGMHKTEPTETMKTKKVHKPIVLHAPTKEHPAQTQMVTEDVTVGRWSIVKESGSISRLRHRELLERVSELHRAVKLAREEANTVGVLPQQDVAVGEAVFDYLFAT